MKKLKSWNITFAAFGGLIGMIFGQFIFNGGDFSAKLQAIKSKDIFTFCVFYLLV